LQVVRLFLAGAFAVISTHAADWQSGVIDGPGGKFSSLRIDTYGNAHVSYVSGMLQYSFWDHSLNRWFTTALDRATGFCSLTLDSKQHPHISYPEYGSGKLKYTYWDGTAWKMQAVQIQARIINYYTSIALDSKDNPSISFYEELGEGDYLLRLRMVTWNGKFWELKTVDSDHGSGKFSSIAINSAGYPEIAYGNVEYKNASLRYARWNGRSWEITVLEGAGKPGTSMWSVALVLDKHDVPHIAYSDVINGIIKYATKVDGKWQLQAVDSVSKVAYPDRNGLALDDQGTPYISYYDAGIGVLKVAHRKDQRWVTEVIDQGFVGFTNSLQIHNGTVWVTYGNDTGDVLKFARLLPEKVPAASPAPSAAVQKATGDSKRIEK
jgi:hypothetical protein